MFSAASFDEVSALTKQEGKPAVVFVTQVCVLIFSVTQDTGLVVWIGPLRMPNMLLQPWCGACKNLKKSINADYASLPTDDFLLIHARF